VVGATRCCSLAGAGETATSLAIKKRGFHQTLGILLDGGATIPRVKAMERYAIDQGFKITAKIIARCGADSLDVDGTMSEEYISYVFERAKASSTGK
jgi:hypothetical protein